MAGSRERQRRRARERYERHQEERFQRRHKLRTRFSILAAVVLVIGLAAGLTLAFSGGPAPAKPKAKASATPSATTVAEPAHHCTYTATGAGHPSMPTASPDYNATYTATINTNLGKIGVSLLNSKATCTVNSFVHMAETNFLNNTQCHRMSNSGGLYILQCGDPNASAKQKLSCSSTTLGTGGPGYQFTSENLKGATYSAGTVAMANSGSANTNGSQFFLVYKNTSLPANYTPFGKITSGLDILQNVAKAGTSCTYQAGGGVPKEKVIIKSMTIRKS